MEFPLLANHCSLHSKLSVQVHQYIVSFYPQLIYLFPNILFCLIQYLKSFSYMA